MPMDVNVGFVSPNGGLQGFGGNDMAVMQRLMESNFDANVLRTNDVLRKDDWVRFDKAVVDIARGRLRGVADLYAAGLTYSVPNALGVTRVEWERQSDMSPAQIDMSGVTEGRNDRLTWDLVGIPLPIIHKDFNINIRALHASRNGGSPLDTTQAEVAARKVAEAAEAMLFDGYGSIVMQNSTIYGYTTAPDRSTVSAAAADWDATTDGANILADVMEMIGKLQADKFYGPYVLYVPLDYHTNLGNDFKTNSDKTIMQRLKEVPGIQDIRPSENLTSEAILVQLTRDVVDMIDGMQPTTLMWPSHGGMVYNFKVMAIMAPRFKSDRNGQSGICHATMS